MADQLFPTYDIPSVNEQRGRYDRDYKRTPEWNVKKGDFVMDAAHRIVESDGRNGYQIWCLKMSQTERVFHTGDVSGTCLGLKWKMLRLTMIIRQ